MSFIKYITANKFYNTIYLHLQSWFHKCYAIENTKSVFHFNIPLSLVYQLTNRFKALMRNIFYTPIRCISKVKHDNYRSNVCRECAGTSVSPCTILSRQINSSPVTVRRSIRLSAPFIILMWMFCEIDVCEPTNKPRSRY